MFVLYCRVATPLRSSELNSTSELVKRCLSLPGCSVASYWPHHINGSPTNLWRRETNPTASVCWSSTRQLYKRDGKRVWVRTTGIMASEFLMCFDVFKRETDYLGTQMFVSVELAIWSSLELLKLVLPPLSSGQQYQLSLDIRSSDLRIFASAIHVHLYLFLSIYEHYFRWKEDPINLQSFVLLFMIIYETL